MKQVEENIWYKSQDRLAIKITEGIRKGQFSIIYIKPKLSRGKSRPMISYAYQNNLYNLLEKVSTEVPPEFKPIAISKVGPILWKILNRHHTLELYSVLHVGKTLKKCMISSVDGFTATDTGDFEISVLNHTYTVIKNGTILVWPTREP